MPLKLKRKFEREYGKEKGDRIFYAWENKKGVRYPKKTCDKKNELILGMKIEKEHSHLFEPSKRRMMIKKIAEDHIKESPCYYSKGLIPMEKRLKRYERRRNEF